jgi:GNAT superfamily N-acetyltransferase
VSATTPAIRRASPTDRLGLIPTVTAAFAEDPGWAFIFGEEYARLAPRFFEALFEQRVGTRSVWVTDDLKAVAMWDPPGESGNASAEHPGSWARLREIAGAPAMERLSAYNDAVAAASPAERYWYLGVLATHPGSQRRGLATAVMAPILEEADRGGLACCLETSTAVNRRFYERKGFTQTTDIVLPGGPPTWWLRRPPAG